MTPSVQASASKPREPRRSMLRALRVPVVYVQHDQADCGPTCLRMVARHHGKTLALGRLRELCAVGRHGASVLGLCAAAESLGLRTLAARLPFARLAQAPLPCIAYWNQLHFVVVYRIDRRGVLVGDPSHGLIRYTKEEFLRFWIGTGANGQGPADAGEGVVVLLEPTPAFDTLADDEERPSERATGLSLLLSYLRPHRPLVTQVLLAMLFSTVVGLIFPFLTQAIVDLGIGQQNLGFIQLVLAAQLMIFAGRATVEFIRARILLYVGNRINVSVISDFLVKLMKLPLGFFGTRQLSDILQRIGDHQRLEQFLTSSSLQAAFSFTYLGVFGAVLLVYDRTLFAIFAVGSGLATAWILVFLRRRRELDFRKFNELAHNQGALIEILNGMGEIRLNGCEMQKRWGWERIQARLFRINASGLAVEQYQELGVAVLTELKDVLITLVAAQAVVSGKMTLGMMMAVQYIVGQMNAPLRQLIAFIRSFQDARNALERMGEVYQHEDEETARNTLDAPEGGDRTIRLRDVSFRYAGSHRQNVLEGLDLDIPEGQVTALVGASGSGKTTLLRLLLGFYPPTSGDILVGGVPLGQVSPRLWRRRCGVVMQDGYLFSDTIARNIALRDEAIDRRRLVHAARVANVLELIESLPLGWNTRVGPAGDGLSHGQRQRLLIARAIYGDPEYLFFDEATSALDANNERTIMENLEQVFRGRTVAVIAHRLSTVRRAHQIIVLDQGRVVERGTHDELTARRGAYFALVKNQLELGT